MAPAKVLHTLTSLFYFNESVHKFVLETWQWNRNLALQIPISNG